MVICCPSSTARFETFRVYVIDSPLQCSLFVVSGRHPWPTASLGGFFSQSGNDNVSTCSLARAGTICCGLHCCGSRWMWQKPFTLNGGGHNGIHARRLKTLICYWFAGVTCRFISVGWEGGFYQVSSTRLIKGESFLSAGLSVNVPWSSKQGQSLL